MGKVNISQEKEVKKVQIDHGIIYLDYGESSARRFALTRGGGEFKATANIRDIPFDGCIGKTKGMQVIDETGATLKVTLLGMTQENIALALPGVKLDGEGEKKQVKAPKVGIIKNESYLKNVTMFCKTLDGEYKKIMIFNPMSEGELSVKTQQKAEGELEIEFVAHHTTEDLTDEDYDLWTIDEVNAIEGAKQQAGQQ